MSTEAQIAANRLNARKSTGPKIAEGKAVVSQNAVKPCPERSRGNGLLAQQDVINCENQHDFDQFRAALLAGLAPAGGVETMMAERIVSLSWRLKRAERMNSEAVDVMIGKIETDWLDKKERTEAGLMDPESGRSELTLGWATIKDFSGSSMLERLLMYERRIESSLYKAMNELQKMQHMREREEAENATHRGQDAHKTQGRDALATETATQPMEKEVEDEEQSQCRPPAGSTKLEILSLSRAKSRDPKQHAQACTIVQNKANWRPLAGNPEHEPLNPKHAGLLPDRYTRSGTTNGAR